MHHGRITGVILGLTLAVWATPALATHRDCTQAERQAADPQLWLNARDQQLSIDTHLPWGAPEISSDSTNERMLTQRDYVIRYDGDLLIPLFAAERVDAARLDKAHRTDCFRRDVRITASQASRPSDYNEAIFDQGHMAAFANQDTSVVAGNNSFIMSNMVPQTCQFNRGIWQILEGITRLWAVDRETVYVISGSILDRNADGRRDADTEAARMKARNGSSRVAVPTAYYKILAYVEADGSLRTLSILMPHNQENPNGLAAFAYLTRHLTTIADIESRTGLDFFPAAPPHVETTALWPFNESEAPNSLCFSQPMSAFDDLWNEAP